MLPPLPQHTSPLLTPSKTTLLLYPTLPRMPLNPLLLLALQAGTHHLHRDLVPPVLHLAPPVLHLAYPEHLQAPGLVPAPPCTAPSMEPCNIWRAGGKNNDITFEQKRSKEDGKEVMKNRRTNSKMMNLVGGPSNQKGNLVNKRNPAVFDILPSRVVTRQLIREIKNLERTPKEYRDASFEIQNTKKVSGKMKMRGAIQAMTNKFLNKKSTIVD